MSIKRIALVGLVAAALTLTACSPSNTPDPTTAPTKSATPKPTAVTYDPPADEPAAITAAEDTITRILKAQSEINAAGGTDASRYDDLAMGKGLAFYQNDAARIAKGPLANEDGKNVDGQAKAEGTIAFDEETAYGQELNGIANGLVILPGCMDTSEYKITTADGKPAYRSDSDRNKIEYQVTYDSKRKLWLVSDLIEFPGETC